MQFLRAHTRRTAKMTVPGPFTMSQQAQDDYYGSPDALGMAYAEAVRAEIVDLFAAGADIVQIDEPYMQARPEPARAYGLDVLRRATDGIDGTVAVHICFGYAAIIHERPEAYSFLPELAATEVDQVSIETAQSGLDLAVIDSLPDKTIILGVLDLSTEQVETPDVVADRIARAFPHGGAARLVAAPDCGMKYLPRDAAYRKLEALVEGASLAAAREGVTA
jgi:5-methyltetrahydropteroyltriglutamate--homocysteine methyltransferase